MKTAISLRSSAESGSALALTMIMTGIALTILASAMSWSATSTRLTHRSIQYSRSVAAAEAGTEKVLARIARDYLTGGEKLVGDSLATYQQIVPTSTDSAFWNGWVFDDAGGNSGRVFVQRASASSYVVLNSTYAGLRGYVSTYRVVAHARESAALQNVVAGVLQDVQLARIPIFQFALYSSGDMEISCGKPFTVTGLVHANKQLYVEPDSALTFQSDVTAVGDIVFGRDPLDTRGTNKGTVVYEGKQTPDVAAMTLPIGTTNTPEAIREIIKVPPSDEDAASPMGRSRYYNQTDMILTVSDSGVSATSGRFDNFTTSIPSNQLTAIITTTNSFQDAREGKTVRPIDINVGAFTVWSQTNSSLRSALGAKDVSSIYVVDNRTLAGSSLGAVRLVNGTTLPTLGLTVATDRPLYVSGDYNQLNPANLGTANTATTLPASLVADAVTILSGNWSDSVSFTSTKASERPAKKTTVNAAILTGVVQTTAGKYSGGMENFPRFLEAWGSANVFTYNGSMVKMFPSLYATNAWGKDEVYDPPKRNWAFDLNFTDPTKLPPLTPSLVRVMRGQWATVASDKNSLASLP